MELCKVLNGRNIVIGVTGGIAVYKVCEVVSNLKKLGACVDVIMTKHAAEFVTPLTFQTLSNRHVTVDMFAPVTSWEVEHISLAQKADVFVIAPASANTIGKYACGIADNMLLTTVLATKAPVVIAPAMNTSMLENTAVQENLKTLEKRGCVILPTESGRLACGQTGNGRMCAPSVIVDKIVELLCPKQDLKGRKVLVTAGATIQKLDAVRYITNFSSGKMGCEIAKNAAERGAAVTLILGKNNVKPPANVSVVSVESTEDMFNAVM